MCRNDTAFITSEPEGCDVAISPLGETFQLDCGSGTACDPESCWDPKLMVCDGGGVQFVGPQGWLLECWPSR